jgi:hypothetical protein
MITPDHAIYISVIELKHDINTLKTSVSVKVFTDDLQDAIRNNNDDLVQTTEAQFVSDNQIAVVKYFNNHLQISINDEIQVLDFIAAKKESDAYFLNFEIQTTSPWKIGKVNATYFMELFPTQSNVLRMTVGSRKYFARLTKSEPLFETTFD